MKLETVIITVLAIGVGWLLFQAGKRQVRAGIEKNIRDIESQIPSAPEPLPAELDVT